jgi:hypothetical protein
VRYGLPHVVAVGPAGACPFHAFRVRPARGACVTDMDDAVIKFPAVAAKNGASEWMRRLRLPRCRILRRTPPGFGRSFLDQAFASARAAFTPVSLRRPSAIWSKALVNAVYLRPSVGLPALFPQAGFPSAPGGRGRRTKGAAPGLSLLVPSGHLADRDSGARGWAKAITRPFGERAPTLST